MDTLNDRINSMREYYEQERAYEREEYALAQYRARRAAMQEQAWVRAEQVAQRTDCANDLPVA